jgi:tRNA threonylcarbamoyl adenosine modification protein (Sua5/YciO/YrdC/YwlC family)
MSLRIMCANGKDRERAMTAALAAVRRGDLVLVPTESAYALMTDAFSARGVRKLREAKGYDPRMPLPVMVGSKSTVAGVAVGISDVARALMDAFWPGLLTIMVRPQPTLAWDLPSDAPLSLRMPLHPVALALLQASGPLVATTANLPGLPAPTDVDDALGQLGDSLSIELDAGDLADPDGLPSTVLDLTGAMPRVVREGAISLAALRSVCDVEVPETETTAK